MLYYIILYICVCVNTLEKWMPMQIYSTCSEWGVFKVYFINDRPGVTVSP